MLSVIGVGIGLLAAAPAGARAQNQPQVGCRDAGQFIAAMARDLGPGFGEFSSGLAALSLRDDFAQGLQAALCNPQA